MSITPVFVQAAYRGRNDDGNETTATFKSASDNQNWTQAVDTNFRVRFSVDETAGGSANNKTFQLQYSTDGSNYNNVDGSSSLVVRASLSPNVTDAAACTHQLTFSSGTFVGGNGFDEADGIAGGANFDVAASGYGEVEFCVQIRSADVANGATVYLRVSSTNLATWNQVPQITVSNPNIKSTPSADPWANEADVQPSLYADYYATFSDPWGALADTTPTIDKQNLGATTPITPPEQTDQWANLADGTVSLYGDHLLTFSDSWENANDVNGVTFNKQDVSQTDITRNLPADDLVNYGEQLGLGIEFRGDSMPFTDTQPSLWADYQITFSEAWANLADTTPTVDKQTVAAGDISKDLGTDDLNFWTDPAYEITADHSVVLDGDSMLLADTTPTINKVDLGTTPITADIPADAWANLADTTPVIDKRGILTAQPAADQWANLADTTPTVELLGGSDITKDISADPWANLADGSLSLIGDHLITLQAEALSFADQTPVINKQDIDKTATPPADAWGDIADSELVVVGVYEVVPDASDAWETLADQTPLIDKQDLAATPITADIPADAWGTLADQTPVYSELGYLTAEPPADTNAAYSERFGLGISVIESLNLWNDGAEATTTGQVAKSYNLAADNLAGYAEVLGWGESQKDPWANLADTTPTVSKIGILKSTPANDPMTMADTTPTVVKTTNKTAAPPADANVAYGERLGTGRGLIDNLANYAERVGLGIRITDDLNGWQDTVQANTGGNYSYTLSDSTLQNWADQPDQNYGKLYGLPTDAMSMGDATPTYTIGIEVSVSDDLVNYDDSTDRIEGLSVGLTDDLANYLEEVRIRGIIPAEIIRLSGQLNSSIGLSGKLEDRLGLSGTLKHGKIGITGKLYDGGG